jgi:hypothetical protein
MKKKKVIMIIGGIIALMCWGGYWSTMNSVRLDDLEYFGMFRYRIDLGHFLIYDRDQVAIEPWIFSYRFCPPYLYTYGISGYTKTDVAPFGKVKKIANMSYYDTIPDDEEIIGPYGSPLKLVQEKFGSQLIVQDSFQNISSEDYQIYQELHKEGAQRRQSYFSSTMIKKKFSERKEELMKMEKDLDKFY